MIVKKINQMINKIFRIIIMCVGKVIYACNEICKLRVVTVKVEVDRSKRRKFSELMEGIVGKQNWQMNKDYKLTSWNSTIKIELITRPGEIRKDLYYMEIKYIKKTERVSNVLEVFMKLSETEKSSEDEREENGKRFNYKINRRSKYEMIISGEAVPPIVGGFETERYTFMIVKQPEQHVEGIIIKEKNRFDVTSEAILKKIKEMMKKTTDLVEVKQPNQNYLLTTPEIILKTLFLCEVEYLLVDKIRKIDASKISMAIQVVYANKDYWLLAVDDTINEINDKLNKELKLDGELFDTKKDFKRIAEKIANGKVFAMMGFDDDVNVSKMKRIVDYLEQVLPI